MVPDVVPTLSRRELLAWITRAAIVAGVPAGTLAALAEADRGYGRDPNLIDPSRTWPLTLSSLQRELIARLADELLPAEGDAPSPSEAGIADFFDEWISAPYPAQRADRVLILKGLSGDSKPSLSHWSADDEFLTAFRRLCVLGFYTSAAGLDAIGHVVPVPSAGFEGPPADVRRRLGV